MSRVNPWRSAVNFLADLLHSPSIVQRRIGKHLEILLRPVERDHELRHKNADDPFLRIDPEIGLAGAGPAMFADRTGNSRLGHIHKYPRPKAETVSAERNRAKLKGHQRGREMVAEHQVDG